MPTDRLTRVNELLRREIGEVILRIMADASTDPSSATVTHVLVTSNLRQARVLVSVRGTAAHQARVMNLLRRERHEIQACINRDVKIKYTPRLAFELDHSLAQGDAVLRILSELGTGDAGLSADQEAGRSAGQDDGHGEGDDEQA
jgi:ribosome-binding factor A